MQRSDATSSKRRRGWLVVLLATISAMAFVATGCGGDSDDSSSSGSGGDKSAAETSSSSPAAVAVKKAQEPVAWEPPGPAIDVASLKGKDVWYVDYDLSIPFEQLLHQGLKEGLSAAGVNLTTVDGKSQVTEFNRGIENAVAQKADAILLGGFPIDLVKPSLEKAKAAGIPVIDTHSGDPGPVPAEAADLVAAQAAHSYSSPGALMADWIAVDSDGSGDIALIVSNELRTSNLVSDAFNKELTSVCPDCNVKEFNVPVSNWDGIQTEVQSILRANPDITYVAPVFDGMALFAVPGIVTAGRADDVKVVSFNASPAVMEMLKKGEVVKADVGSATVLQGWGYADQTYRVLLDEEPLDDIEVPERLFTEANINDIDLKGLESTWYTDVNWEDAYKQLWGLG